MDIHKQPLSDREKNRKIEEWRRRFFEQLAVLKKERDFVLAEYRQAVEKARIKKLRRQL